MIRKLVAKVKQPTLNGILSGFKKTAEDLRTLKENNARAAAKHDIAISRYESAIDTRQQAIDSLNFESKRADAVAQKIEALIS